MSIILLLCVGSSEPVWRRRKSSVLRVVRRLGPMAKKRRGGSGSGSGGVRSTAAGSSTGGGSQHSTATAMEPAKKRRVDSGTSTAAGTSTGGGSQHSTATTSLLFADAGFVDDELKNTSLQAHAKFRTKVSWTKLLPSSHVTFIFVQL